MHAVPQSLLGLVVNPADVPAAGGVLDDASWARALTGFLSFIPHTARLNVRVEEVAAPAIRMQLPWQPALIGDPHRRLVHGGVLTMFADTLCGSAVLTGLSAPEVCPTLDLRLDHYRPGVEGLALVGEARVLRVTESMVFTEAQIWQQPGKILCRAIGNFVRLGERNTPSGFAEALLAAANAQAPANPSIHESEPLGQSAQAAQPADEKTEPQAPRDAQDPRGLLSARRFVEGQRTHADLAALLASLPYAQAIGLGLCAIDGQQAGAASDVELHPEQALSYSMAAMPDNVGNPMLPAVHGGVLAAAMETAATLEVLRRHGRGGREARLPKLIDFSIDYLATARGDQVTRIDCEVMREGRRMTNVRVSAWQKSREQPVASARMHFVLESLASP